MSQHCGSDGVGLPRLCFVGSLLGTNTGRVPSQSEVLADLFEGDGFPVRRVSHHEGRLSRALDTTASLISWRKRIDIAFVDVFSGPAFGMADLSSWILRTLKVPVVFVLRGGGLPAFARRYPRWVDRVLSRGHCLVSPSGFLAHELRAPDRRIRVIFNVIRSKHYEFVQRSNIAPRLLWMRSFHEIYNPELALRAFKEILKAHPDARLTMAGQNSGALDSTMQLADEMGLRDHVRFPGFLDLEGKRREFASHDIYLNTNRVDNMPVSVLESAAFGVPVVASRVGGIPYLLDDGETALLTGDDDADGMARAVCRLLRDPALCRKLSDNGRLLAESCDWPRIRIEWKAVLDGVRR